MYAHASSTTVWNFKAHLNFVEKLANISQNNYFLKTFFTRLLDIVSLIKYWRVPNFLRIQNFTIDLTTYPFWTYRFLLQNKKSLRKLNQPSCTTTTFRVFLLTQHCHLFHVKSRNLFVGRQLHKNRIELLTISHLITPEGT